MVYVQRFVCHQSHLLLLFPLALSLRRACTTRPAEETQDRPGRTERILGADQGRLKNELEGLRRGKQVLRTAAFDTVAEGPGSSMLARTEAGKDEGTHASRAIAEESTQLSPAIEEEGTQLNPAIEEEGTQPNPAIEEKATRLLEEETAEQDQVDTKPQAGNLADIAKKTGLIGADGVPTGTVSSREVTSAAVDKMFHEFDHAKELWLDTQKIARSEASIVDQKIDAYHLGLKRLARPLGQMHNDSKHLRQAFRRQWRRNESNRLESLNSNSMHTVEMDLQDPSWLPTAPSDRNSEKPSRRHPVPAREGDMQEEETLLS